ncbi:MAG: putative transporter permease protein [Actinomycetia bacterium]|nr:putative transporter permease protein [Actinomycetes bacterium]
MANEPAPIRSLVSTGSDPADPGSGGDGPPRTSPSGDPAASSSAVRRPGAGSAAWFRAHWDLGAKVLAIAVFLAVWQASGAFLNPLFVSTPGKVVAALGSLIANGQLPAAFLHSLLEMLGALVVAAVLGIGTGLLMGRVRLAERALEPIVAFGNATPSIALLPVMEVWFGIGTAARVAFITVICTWPLLVNTYAGVRAVRGRYRDVGAAFGFGPWRQTWKIYLPGTVPFIFVGIRIALAVGAVGMILGGQEIGQSGLGGLTADFGSYSETADLVATIVTTTALAMLLFLVFRRLQDWRFPWVAATSAGRRGSIGRRGSASRGTTGRRGSR